MFFQFLCQELSMDRKDMMSFFNQLQEKDFDFCDLFENYSITKLDVNRMLVEDTRLVLTEEIRRQEFIKNIQKNSKK